MIRLKFEFTENTDPTTKQKIYRLLDFKPFPSEVLPALLVFACQEIVKLDLPADNTWKVVAEDVLRNVMPWRPS